MLISCSILGFIILLKQNKPKDELQNESEEEDKVNKQAFYGIMVVTMTSACYNLLFFRRLSEWYYYKVIRTSILNELSNASITTNIAIVNELHKRKVIR